MSDDGNVFHIASEANASVRITIKRAGNLLADLQLPNDQAAYAAALLLNAARDAFTQAKARQEPIHTSGNVIPRLNIQPTKIGLAPSPTAGHEVLALEFGDVATIGISIPREQLRWLGEAALALSAGGTKQ